MLPCLRVYWITHVYHVTQGDSATRWHVWTHEPGTPDKVAYARNVTEERALEMCGVLRDAGYVWGRS